MRSFVHALALCILCGLTSPSAASAAKPADEWARLAAMPVAKDDFAAAAVDGRIYAFGGMTGPRGSILDDAEVYDPALDAWRLLPPVPTARRSVRAAAVGSIVYVGGGVAADGPTGAVEAFDTAAGSWSQRRAMPTPRYGMAVVASGGLIYAIGGFRDGSALATVERYDPATDRWDARAAMPTPRTHLAAVAQGGVITAMGGEADHGALTAVERYDPVGDRWASAPPLPEPLSNFPAVVLDGRIHVLEHAVHAVFDPADGTWSAAAPMPTPRHGLGLVVVGEVMYAFGGCHQRLFDLDIVEVYRASGVPQMLPTPLIIGTTPPSIIEGREAAPRSKIKGLAAKAAPDGVMVRQCAASWRFALEPLCRLINGGKEFRRLRTYRSCRMNCAK